MHAVCSRPFFCLLICNFLVTRRSNWDTYSIHAYEEHPQVQPVVQGSLRVTKTTCTHTFCRGCLSGEVVIRCRIEDRIARVWLACKNVQVFMCKGFDALLLLLSEESPWWARIFWRAIYIRWLLWIYNYIHNDNIKNFI